MTPPNPVTSPDPNTIARRVCILQELGSRADWVSHTTVEDHERLAVAVAAIGRAASSVDDADRLRMELVRAGGTLLHWIELLDAEAAR